MFEELYKLQHLSEVIGWKQFPKGLLQIEEQQYFWEDTGDTEFEEACTC